MTDRTRRRRLPGPLRRGATMLLALGVLALVAPWLATSRPWIDGRGSSPTLRAPVPWDPAEIRLDEALRPPSVRHPMGTDDLGRDLASRVIHGTRVSLGVGLLSALFALALGLPLGALAGSLGGWIDAAISRTIEAVLCLPALLLVLALLATAPPWLRDAPPMLRIALVLGVTGWVPIARYLRGEFLRLGATDMAVAARAAGAGRIRVAVRHVLPSALAPVLVTASFAVAASILLEATLSFLGLGVPPPTPTWGGLLAEAREQIGRAWWLATFPGVALFVTVLGCNLLGEGLRDLLDPRSPRR